jgi:hypothetical protein
VPFLIDGEASKAPAVTREADEDWGRGETERRRWRYQPPR